jgi:hypothetical protein
MSFSSQIKLFVGLLFLLIFSVSSYSQTPDASQIRELVLSFKKDLRGPYQAIRWFCPDGTVLPPQERCPEPGGIQHALPKDVVQKIARERGIYLGQILAGISFPDFLDETNQNSRLKQYQLEQYLQAVDDGWIMRRARFYRGAIQAEDEADWGKNFLTALAADNELVSTQFFLIRQAAKDIPHNGNDDRWQTIRTLSKTIGDSLPAFMDLRVKLHGQPDAGDRHRVIEFQKRHEKNIPPEIVAMLEKLVFELEKAYQPFDMKSLNYYIERLPENSPVTVKLRRIIRAYSNPPASPEYQKLFLTSECKDIGELLWIIRRNMLSTPSPGARLTLLDLSNEMESLLFRSVGTWEPENIAELLEKTYLMAKAAAGAGYIEIWEWEVIEPTLFYARSRESLPLEKFKEKSDYAGRVVEWGTGMIRAIYEPPVTLFRGFEPVAGGFIDARVRSSILLPLGEAAGELKEVFARLSGVSNNVMAVGSPGQVRGLNPGFARGELVVKSGPANDMDFSSRKIYLLERAPADMKPVAGIATVAEGNLVSHVQLLARNSGIPNAVFSLQNLNDLLPFSGQTVFYAVSPGGRVILKPESEMTAEEKVLFTEKKRSETKIAVPVDKLNLAQSELISLKKLRASDSGRLSGPKAANLGELKYLFPDKVVEGFAIPFGIFRRHMERQMPGGGTTYWQFLQNTFAAAERDRNNGVSEAAVEEQVLNRLAQLREAIRKMAFSPEFQSQIRQAFLDYFRAPIGQLGVFIRSDTNMEDLKDFTGAGLNLTVFNVVEEDKIYQGIRDVWASPYSERSYRWRQKYLLNPENVFPSILILPSVAVEKSGVMITSGVSGGNPEDITVAFSRGAGGAVEGQVAESYLLKEKGLSWLLSPSREVKYTLLPAGGGTKKGIAYFNQPLLRIADLNQLRTVAAEIRNKMAQVSGIHSSGPFDVELGFKDGKIFLFQIRPYVENKRAQSSIYLRGLDPELPKNLVIDLRKKL